MKSFIVLTGIAAPLPMINIDTDMIIPKQFLKTIKRTGLGKNLFDEMRFTIDGKEKPDFILNKPKYRGANILISGDNFGCGSSREHAPWALLDFGITCIIAPSFADIFFNNCFKNGILPIVLPETVVRDLTLYVTKNEGVSLTIDLPKQLIKTPDGKEIPFNIDPFRKHCLVNGLDDIGLTLEHKEAIDSFEVKQKTKASWLYDAA